MRTILLSLTALAGVTLAAAGASAAPAFPVDRIAVPAHVQTVQFYRHYEEAQYQEGWRQREWRRREWERRHHEEEWRRHHDYTHGW